MSAPEIDEHRPAPTGATPTDFDHADVLACELLASSVTYKHGLSFRRHVSLARELLADRDRLAAEVKSLEVEHASALDRAYDDGWSEGFGSSGADS